MDADFLSKEALNALMEERASACVSIYLPMVRVGPDTRGNPIQLKNGLAEAEALLQEKGWEQDDIDDLLDEARDLLNDADFWQHQLDGLALFISPETYATYRLPLDFEPLTVVGERFHIKPLLPLFSDDGRFYILALTQKDVRLFQGTRHVVDEIDVKFAPQSIDDALWYDEPEAQLQHHTSTSGAGAGPDVVHHGHGVDDDQSLQQLRRYFQDVSEGIEKQLRNEDAPIVLAALDYVQPIYKEVNDSPHLLDEGVTEDPSALSMAELHERAWPIVEPLFLEAKEDVTARYRQLSGSEQASAELETIVPLAYQGRVDALFVAVGVQQWGSYRPAQDRLEMHAEQDSGDEDLLDYAALQTLQYGGSVYAVEQEEIPDEAPIAAVFRF